MTGRHLLASLAVVVGLAAAPAQAFGPRGHSLVGAVADQRLAGGQAGLRVTDLLDGLTLAEAALIPDEIKDWDKHDPRTNRDTFHLPAHPALETDLIEFWAANTGKDGKPFHRSFHFCDVPVGAKSYRSGTTGRTDTDLVHMIPFCVKVLKGTTPENNDRKITKRVAVILLAHYLGDIHQPLHVGAQYFDANGKPTNPDDGGEAFGDEGGNSLTLVYRGLGERGTTESMSPLHIFWDDESVAAAVGILQKEIRDGPSAPSGPITDAFIAKRLALQEPAGWKLPAGTAVEDWSVGWADDILPAARQAHDRLDFQHVTISPAKKQAVGRVLEKDAPADGLSYRAFAGAVVRGTIHKGGWRLASLLETVLGQP